MQRIKNKIKQSFFIVNKVYLFIAFLLISIQDIGLGIIYFLGTLFIFIWKTLRSKVPMEVNSKIEMKSYVYKKVDEKELKMDIYYPLDQTKKNYPVVYFCHGGGWISGFRNQPNNISWCKYLASRGFVASSIDYRYGYKNSINDLLADYSDGIDFIRSNANDLRIDDDKIVLMGLSAGAHLALLYASYYTFIEDDDAISGIQSAVAYYPPSDLKDLFDRGNKSLFARFAARRTLKGTPTSEEEVYTKYSPTTWISERMLPTLLVHGKQDSVVPFNSSVKLIKKLQSLNIPSTLLVHNKGFHSFDTDLKDYATINIIKKTIRFIKSSIRGDIQK